MNLGTERITRLTRVVFSMEETAEGVIVPCAENMLRRDASFYLLVPLDAAEFPMQKKLFQCPKIVETVLSFPCA